LVSYFNINQSGRNTIFFGRRALGIPRNQTDVPRNGEAVVSNTTGLIALLCRRSNVHCEVLVPCFHRAHLGTLSRPIPNHLKRHQLHLRLDANGRKPILTSRSLVSPFRSGAKEGERRSCDKRLRAPACRLNVPGGTRNACPRVTSDLQAN
jgi:hypothetical protein